MSAVRGSAGGGGRIEGAACVAFSLELQRAGGDLQSVRKVSCGQIEDT